MTYSLHASSVSLTNEIVVDKVHLAIGSSELPIYELLGFYVLLY